MNAWDVIQGIATDFGHDFITQCVLNYMSEDDLIEFASYCQEELEYEEVLSNV